MQEYYWLILIVTLIVGLGIGLMVLIKMKGSKIGAANQRYFAQQWKRVMLDKYANPARAIMDADKILDKVMAQLGYSGHLGEKLKRSRSIFGDINGVWRAHKLRNKLAHELDFRPSKREIDDALANFKRALTDLGLKIR
ncbi:hypothetical protein KKG71_06165 [Patescibacteria group bacterium]|nr:hypothetical protein [Patescibacteria group bacterium]